MMGHHGYMMNPNQGNYMDPHGPQGGYMLPTPPRHPMESQYDAPPHYYANGSQFQQQEQQADPYYYSPARTQQPQHPSMQQQQQPPPHYQQGYGGPPPAGSPHGYATPSSQHGYPSAADHRAPFRLHSSEMTPEPARSPAQSKQPDMPELHRGSVHQPKVQQQQPQQEQRQSATITRPVPATRNLTPLRGSQSSSNGPPTPSMSAAGSPSNSGGVFHAAMPTPSIDDMEPQNVSFIETPSSTGTDGVDEADLVLPRRLRNLNITSGNRTYRIPHEATQSSPPRPALMKTFRGSPSPSTSPASPSPSSVYLPQQPHSSGSDSPDEAVLDEGVKTAKLKDNVEADRGFIITFDDVATGPKRPKPQLGAKRQPSPKKLSTHSAPLETVSSSSTYNHNKAESSRVRLFEPIGRPVS